MMSTTSVKDYQFKSNRIPELLLAGDTFDRYDDETNTLDLSCVCRIEEYGFYLVWEPKGKDAGLLDLTQVGTLTPTIHSNYHLNHTIKGMGGAPLRHDQRRTGALRLGTARNEGVGGRADHMDHLWTGFGECQQSLPDSQKCSSGEGVASDDQRLSKVLQISTCLPHALHSETVNFRDIFKFIKN